MRVTRTLFCAFAITSALTAQVLSPEEIRDPQLSALQRKYQAELKTITKEISAHSFPYHFYFSRKLDLAEKEQPQNDQRSVQFDRYRDQVVLKITGNYFASYSAELMVPEARARETYQDVILPLLKASADALEKADAPQAFAFEISHHVRKKALGLASEFAENVVLIVPKAAAQRAAAANNPESQHAAVLEGEAFLNAVPISFWPRPEGTVAKTQPEPQKSAAAPVQSAPPIAARIASEPIYSPPPLPLVPKQPVPAAVPQAMAHERDTSPEALKQLQSSYQADLDRMVQELDSQAHFVRYAPPAFIPFHQGLYLQLSMTTTLPQAAAASQYALAAQAFDQHIAHLIRPVTGFFKNASPDFDGIDYSTSVRLSGDETAAGSAIAVEFIFLRDLLRAYAQFDCTGQQLIDGSFILINGERVSLNLQAAAAGAVAAQAGK